MLCLMSGYLFWRLTSRTASKNLLFENDETLWLLRNVMLENVRELVCNKLLRVQAGNIAAVPNPVETNYLGYQWRLQIS